jgi:hypothetical protein
MTYSSIAPDSNDLPRLEEVLAEIPSTTQVTITIPAARGVVVTYTDTGRKAEGAPSAPSPKSHEQAERLALVVQIARARLKESTRRAEKIYVWHQASYGGYQVLATTNPENPTRGAIRLTGAYGDVEDAFEAADAIAAATELPLASRRQRHRR